MVRTGPGDVKDLQASIIAMGCLDQNILKTIEAEKSEQEQLTKVPPGESRLMPSLLISSYLPQALNSSSNRGFRQTWVGSMRTTSHFSPFVCICRA